MPPPSGEGGGQGGRGGGRKFAKGQSGNPGGRPKLLKELKEKIQTRGGELVDKLFEIAFDPPRARKLGRRFILDGASPKERVMAIEKLLAYGYGKPVQAVELSGPGGGPVESVMASVGNMTSGERRKRIAELLAKAAASQAPVSAAADAPPADDHDLGAE